MVIRHAYDMNASLHTFSQFDMHIYKIEQFIEHCGFIELYYVLAKKSFINQCPKSVYKIVILIQLLF